LEQERFIGARDSDWQWHQLGRMQIFTLNRHISRQHPTTQFFTGQMPFLPPNQQRQSTEGMFYNQVKFQKLSQSA